MSIVQSIMFERKQWKLPTIKKWLKDNDFKYYKNDKTTNYIRIRQVDPDNLKGYQFRAKKSKHGIIFIIAYKSKKKGGAVSAENLQNFYEQSYQDNPIENINGYIYDPELSHATAKTYYNPETKHAVITHRGTKGIMDWGNNLAYATGLYNYTDRYAQGKKAQEAVEKKYGKENISTLGHSQGAVLARKLGKNTKEIINLNPAYLGEVPAKNEYTVRSASDVVSAPYAPVSLINKKSTTIAPKSWFDPLGEHKPSILSRLDPRHLIGGFLQQKKFKKFENYLKHLGLSPAL
jgi:hypothetical protein